MNFLNPKPIVEKILSLNPFSRNSHIEHNEHASKAIFKEISENLDKEPEIDEDELYIKVNEFIWGKGQFRPSDTDLSFDLLKPMGLNSSMSFLDLHCGVGHTVREAARKFKTWGTGYADREVLFEKGKTLSELSGLSKKAIIEMYDYKNFTLKKTSLDGLLCRDLFYKIEDKDHYIKTIYESLKHLGQFAFTDYVLVNKEAPEDLLNQWEKAEGTKLHIATEEEYRSYFSEIDFELRIVEDISYKVIPIINERWAMAFQTMNSQAMNKRFLNTLLKECQKWTTRLSLMEAKVIRNYRFYLIRHFVE